MTHGTECYLIIRDYHHLLIQSTWQWTISRLATQYQTIMWRHIKAIMAQQAIKTNSNSIINQASTSHISIKYLLCTNSGVTCVGMITTVAVSRCYWLVSQPIRSQLCSVHRQCSLSVAVIKVPVANSGVSHSLTLALVKSEDCWEYLPQILSSI